LLSRLSIHEGDLEAARDFADQAVTQARNIGMTFLGPSVLAQKAALSDDRQESRALLKEGEELLDSGCVAHNQFWFPFTAIDQALAAEDWDEAARFAKRLETFTQAQPLAWSDFAIDRANAMTRWGRGERNDVLKAEIDRLRDLALKTGLKPAATALGQLRTT